MEDFIYNEDYIKIPKYKKIKKQRKLKNISHNEKVTNSLQKGFPEYKKCSKCDKIKHITLFSRKASSKDGYCNSCKICEDKRNKEYQKKNKGKISERKRKLQIEMGFKTNHIKYNLKNSYKSIEHKIINLLKLQIKSAFNNKIKIENIEKWLFCSIDNLKLYLESFFKIGMSWDIFLNTNLINIDHIKPIASFDLSNPEQVKQCFHYTNLQLLWWWQNASKGNRETWTSIGELFNESA